MKPDILTAWNSFQSGLRRFVYSKVKDRAVTEDIVQDVFLKIHSKINSVRDHTKIKSWLYSLTYNAIIDHFRNQKRQIDPIFFNTGTVVANFNECVSNYMTKLIVGLPENTDRPFS
ncbi:MAG: hypothetical protein HC859_14195 [Bacteroidia bacterium]|nr:hypothetical protein [Bacteroidia bacterium]